MVLWHQNTKTLPTMCLVVFGGTDDSEKNSRKFCAIEMYSSNNGEHWRFADLHSLPHLTAQPPNPSQGRHPSAPDQCEHNVWAVACSGGDSGLTWNLRGRETGVIQWNSDFGKCISDGVKVVADQEAEVEAETKPSQTNSGNRRVTFRHAWCGEDYCSQICHFCHIRHR